MVIIKRPRSASYVTTLAVFIESAVAAVGWKALKPEVVDGSTDKGTLHRVAWIA